MVLENGLDSLWEQRRRGLLSVPVVVIFTYSDPVQLVRARKLGVKRCQSKSISLNGIRAAIEAARNEPAECIPHSVTEALR
jgi:DNA-binding NarL/FixJ family response regulator